MDKKSFKSKWDNYWYYYKYHTLAGIFIVGVIILIIIAIVNKDGEVELTLVDTTALVNDTGMKSIYEGFSEEYDIDSAGLLIKSQSDYVDDITAERTGAKSIARAIESGEIDGIFVYRGIEIKQEYIGDINNVLPQDLLSELDEYLIGYLGVDENGETYNTDVIAGIAVNEAKRFVETYGDIEDYVVLQIPENCQHLDNVIAFVKYLFDIE